MLEFLRPLFKEASIKVAWLGTSDNQGSTVQVFLCQQSDWPWEDEHNWVLRQGLMLGVETEAWTVKLKVRKNAACDRVERLRCDTHRELGPHIQARSGACWTPGVELTPLPRQEVNATNSATILPIGLMRGFRDDL
jgi:hypothetical protein